MSGTHQQERDKVIMKGCAVCVINVVLTDNPPTPHYNNALLRDMGSYQRHLHGVYTASQDCVAFADAVMLFKVWLRQRELLKVCLMQGSYTLIEKKSLCYKACY